MTMTITLELSPEMEAKLREGIARHDAESVRQLLADALTPTVEALLRQASEQLSEDEFEALADQLADALAEHLEPNTPVLSDYAVSRAGIYEDHP
jgi:antitoxin ParD1/3/4